MSSTHFFFFFFQTITNSASESESDLTAEIIVFDVLSTGTVLISSPVSETTTADL